MFEHRLYLNTVDYYSRWIEVSHLATRRARKVIVVLKMLFSKLAVPNKLRSDMREASSTESFACFQTNGFIHIMSSPRYPQSNCFAERSVGIVKRLWRDSESKLEALLAYRSTPTFAPAERLYGRPMKCLLDKACDIVVDYELFKAREKERKASKREQWES